MRVRTNYIGFLDSSRKYYDAVFKEIGDLQFTQGDGPIIAFQIDNEYGVFGNDQSYLSNLRDAMVDSGCTEMIFTSDNARFLSSGSLPGTMAAVNFNQNAQSELDSLRDHQPDFPLMVAEFWSGWYVINIYFDCF